MFWMFANTDLHWAWQCLGWSYLNGKLVWHPRVQLRQDTYNFYVGGINTDRNTAMANDFGQWRLGVAAPAPVNPLMRLETPYQHNEAVTFYQTIAALKGLTPKGFVVDGVFGPATEAVTKAIQKKAGLAVDGVAGPLTLDWLGKYKPPVQLPVPPPAPPKPAVPATPKPAVPEPFKTVSAKPGDTGPLVATIQNSLNVVSKCGLKVNGSYDAATTQAVKNLQNFVKIPATGIVDGNTMATLQYFLSLKT
jgi:peptidoglycan hydrolase-like protein with peptidoglycan-binding domain